MRFGSVQFQQGGSAQTSRRIHNHPSFTGSRYSNYDIAVIHIPSPLTLGGAIQAIRLPRRAQQTETFIGQLGTISGWGQRAVNRPFENHLLWARVRFIPNADCRGQFGTNAIVDHVICSRGSSGLQSQGICMGDFGGPLTITENGIRTQIGIASFTSWTRWGRCTGNRPNGYMRTASFLTWIHQHTNIPIRN